MSDDREQRARARAKWPGALTTLEHQSDAALVVHGSPGERIAMVWRITLDAWAMSGRAWPEYERANMPGRLIRAGND